ncbi:MAG TPA: SCP2 sterol-binding domain-containing protein [Bacillales bacterium]|nr:SCP2 sterol-binding domain-containing protein [Bacillales bacterium]
MAENHPMKKVFANIEKNLKANPKPIQGMNAVYRFDISGASEETYRLYLSDGDVRVEYGDKKGSADCRILMKEKDFMDMLLGRLNGTSAFMTGKLKVRGNIGLAMKLQNVLGRYVS